MSTLDLAPDSRRNPTEVITDLALSEEAVELMPECSNMLAFLDRLCDEELFHDAFVSLARVLPKQYGIIWADRCIQDAPPDECSEAEQLCLDTVRQWIQNPDESLRRAALDAAEASEFEGAYAWFAAAVGFSSGSLAPHDQAEVPPPQHLTAVAIAACLVMLATRDPDTMDESSRKMIDTGLAMVAIPGGGN